MGFARSGLLRSVRNPSPVDRSPGDPVFYHVDYACADSEPLQKELNVLYEYGADLETKVAHRSRLNLFFLLMKYLQDRGLVSKPRRALDIGCHAGAFSKIISELGAVSVLGIDVSDDLIRRARARFASELGGRVVEFRAQRAEDLSDREAFDFVLCTEVIEHVDRPHWLVEAIPELLVPGGVAVVSLPNAMSIPYLARLIYRKVRRRPIERDLADHLRYPSYRCRRLFRGGAVRVVMTVGANLFLTGPVLRALHRSPSFSEINRLNFAMSSRWPFKYFSQSFFLVLQKEPDAAAR